MIAYVPPGFFPEDESDASVFHSDDIAIPPLLLVQVDRVNPAALAHLTVRALLGDERCRFRGDSVCDSTPVQGIAYSEPFANKHHAEGNGESADLFPLLKPGPYDEFNERDYHISAYNYAMLYKAIKRRFDFAYGSSPDS